MAYLSSSAALVISAENGVVANVSGTFDSGSVGEDRLLVAALMYENGGDPGVSSIIYGGVELTKEIVKTVSPSDDFSETIEIWYLADPATGSNTLELVNSSTSHDFMLMAAVYTGRSQSVPVLSANSVTIARQLSDDGTTTIDKPSEEDDVFWVLVQDRGGDTAWALEPDNSSRLANVFGGASNGQGMVIGDRVTGSGSVVEVGATQTDLGPEGEQDLVGAFVVLQPSNREISGSGSLQSGGAIASAAGSTGRKATGALQAQPASMVASDVGNTASGVLQAQPAGMAGIGEVAGPAVEDVRVVDCVLQQKKRNQSAYVNVHDLTLCGGGAGDTINVEGRVVTAAQLGYEVTNDPVLGRQRLQAFIDDLATFGVPGVINAGAWAIDGQLDLHDGLRLMGEGMQRTVIDCPPDAWTTGPDNFTAMRLDAGGGLNPNGVLLRDFKIIGADKTAADSGGGLIRLHGLDDFLVERVWVEDASSYGIFVAGYGVGSFTNGIESDFWNSTFRGVVRNCVTRRGQIGIGTEGGAEGILIAQNDVDGLRADGGFGLHCFRSASGRNVWYVGNRGQHCRTGFLIDRHRHMEYAGNWMNEVRIGWSVGGYNDSDAPAVSRDVRIHDNYYNGVVENGNGPTAILDSFQGTSVKHTDGLAIVNNQFKNGNISLRNSRRVSIQGNIGLNGTELIRTFDPVDGIVANNLMDLGEVSPGVVTSGTNQGF